MSTLTIFAMIVAFIFLIGGWISSEYISSRNTKQLNALRLQVAKLERENDMLQTNLNNETKRFVRMDEEYQKVKDAKTIIRNLEQDFKRLENRYLNNLRGIDVIRKTVSSKKYFNNSLAKEINILLEEHLPDAKQQEMKKIEESRAAFKRIKNGL